MIPQLIKDNIKVFEDACLNLVIGGQYFSYEKYEITRDELINDLQIVKLLPNWIIEYRYGSNFYRFINHEFKTKRDRKDFIRTEILNLQNQIEFIGVAPTAFSIQNNFTICNSESIYSAWQKCFERRINDPEGAITSARTLVETVCKYILENLNEVPDDSGDLKKLYKQTAKILKLAPSQHDELLFKQILTGCSTVVEGLASLRNKLGDAHGHSSKRIKPSKRHAELAVNFAGSLSSFLISTYEEIHKKSDQFIARK